MSIIKKPFTQLVADLGATHHWPMTSTDPLNEDIIGGSQDLGISASSITAQNANLLEHSSDQYADTTNGGPQVNLDGLATHYANAGLSEWTLVIFAKRTGSGYPGYLLGFDINGSVGDVSWGSQLTEQTVTYPSGTTTHTGTDFTTNVQTLALTAHPDGEVSIQINGNWIGKTTTGNSDPANVAVQHIVNPNNIGFGLGHILFFPRALETDEVTTIHEQRIFTGKISGTATVDGSGAQATLRAINRADGSMAGEAVAATDGTYELWVTDPGDMDVLAIPPSGVAARPLAHGPIVPVNQN